MQTELEELQKKLIQVIEYAEKQTGKLVKVEEETNRKVRELCSIIRTNKLVFTFLNNFIVHTTLKMMKTFDCSL